MIGTVGLTEHKEALFGRSPNQKLWLNLTIQFKYASSLPQCEQGNILKESKKDFEPTTLLFQQSKQESHLWQILQTKPNKKSLYFKYQCLFWSSFCTMQVEGSMLRFDQNFKIFSCGFFWVFVAFLVCFFFEKHVECPYFFSKHQKTYSGKRQEG